MTLSKLGGGILEGHADLAGDFNWGGSGLFLEGRGIYLTPTQLVPLTVCYIFPSQICHFLTLFLWAYTNYSSFESRDFLRGGLAIRSF